MCCRFLIRLSAREVRCAGGSGSKRAKGTIFRPFVSLPQRTSFTYYALCSAHMISSRTRHARCHVAVCVSRARSIRGAQLNISLTIVEYPLFIRAALRLCRWSIASSTPHLSIHPGLLNPHQQLCNDMMQPISFLTVSFAVVTNNPRAFCALDGANRTAGFP